eukprot:gene10965-9581_t
MENSRLIVRADGIADKPFTYHVGIVYAEDTRKMSAFSQRDFIVGVLPEKNQFAMILCARQIGQLAVAMRNSAVAVYMNMDMAALKNLSRGVCEQPGGFAIKDFNAKKGFCIWHKACTKEDWEYDKLLIILCAWSTVDGPHDRAFDPTRVPPARKKNVLGSHCDTILENTEGDTSAFFARLKAIKWGILPDLSPCGPICP